MPDFVLHGEACAPGASAAGRIPVARLPTGIPFDLPVHVFRGPEPGGVLLLHTQQLPATADLASVWWRP